MRGDVAGGFFVCELKGIRGDFQIDRASFVRREGDLDPMLSQFVVGAPVAGPRPTRATVDIAYGLSERYYKAQVGYTSPQGTTLPGGAQVPQSN
ncbi:hypothetical protein ACQP2U_05840 [Nocardia sp. CA-084685]|uniref:hypothetical protein n=1 Tax=Nocardia sp. CA-084685 TaxID=3239970 RepID=UPI003D9800A7